MGLIKVNSREDFLKEVNKKIPHNSYIVELGVLRGEFSSLILQYCLPRELILIDPFMPSDTKYQDGLTTAYSTTEDLLVVKNKFDGDGRIRIIVAYSNEIVASMRNNYFDLIYIDASHLYEDVKTDLNQWSKKLIDGGILAGHDYIKNKDFGVIQAVDEFCLEHDLEIFILNENGGDWAIIV